MSSYQQGAVAGLQAEFLDHPSGNPVDPTSITLSVLDVNGATVAGPWTYPTNVVRTALGIYLYSWTVPGDLAPADYTASWTAVIAGATRVGYETFTVLVGAQVQTGPQSWATVTDVLNITGQTITGTQLVQAQAIIDMAAGRTYLAAPRTGTRDAYWLKLAVAYQGAWMTGQPDIFSRLDIQALPGTGRPVPLGPNAIMIAPMAKWALKRVSWLKTRSVHILSPYVDGLSPVSPDASSSANDFYESWTGM